MLDFSTTQGHCSVRFDVRLAVLPIIFIFPHTVPGMISHGPSTEVIAGVMETAVTIKKSVDAEGSF